MCIETSRTTGPATGITLNWYRDGIRLQRQTVSPWQSYLGWSTYYEFNFNRMIWLKRDEDTEATERVFLCHLGKRDPVGVYYPSECGYFKSAGLCQRKCVHACLQ